MIPFKIPKKDGHCMAITTRSGKVLYNHIFAGTEYEQVNEQDGTQEDESKPVD